MKVSAEKFRNTDFRLRISDGTHTECAGTVGSNDHLIVFQTSPAIFGTLIETGAGHNHALRLACSLIRFLLLLRDIRSGSYYVLFGTCVKREPSLFKKSQQITFKSDDGKEYHFTFEKSIKLLEGHRYKLYFRKNSSSTESIDSVTPDLLGFEAIVEQLQKQTKSNE